MSAPRYPYPSTPRKASIARASRAPLAAAAVIVGAALCPSAAAAQDVAYCDPAIAQQASKLQQNGDAAVVSAGLRKKQGIRLTEEKDSQRSTVFHNIPIAFGPGASFYQHFRVRISGGLQNPPPNGADGLAFIIQNDPGGDPLMVGKIGTGNKAIGVPGAGLGYGGITQSLALELDTFKNDTELDPDGNHLALLFGGYVSHTEDGTPMGKPLDSQPENSTVAPYQAAALDPATRSLEATGLSSDTRDVWIDYECAAADNCTMKVYLAFNSGLGFADPTDPNSLPKKPDMPSMTVEGLKDVAGYLNGSTGFVGFSASTGANADEHLVTFWVSGRTPLADSDGNKLEDACECKSFPTACDGNLPICDTKSDLGYCRDCLDDAECLGKNDPTKPYCDLIATGGAGACVECIDDSHCGADKPFCNTLTKACTANCSDDKQCDDKKWCDNPSGVPFSGTCTDDLANGSPIPKSDNHMPALDGTCTPEVAVVVCLSGVCDEADDQCGLSSGGPCTSENATDVCRSGVCSPEGTCACAKDADCGDAASGRVCDAAKGACLDGCRGKDGNGCPTGLECSSATSDVGQCKMPGTGGPNNPLPQDQGSVEGAGLIRCGTSHRGASGGEPAALLFLAAVAGGLVRRRRR